MIFGRKKNWDDQYDSDYLQRSDRDPRAKRSTVWIHVSALIVIAGTLLAVTGMVAGQTMFEKTATSLASPTGLVWLLLLITVYFGFLFRQTTAAVLALLAWLVLTVFGSRLVSEQLIYSLEKDLLAIETESIEPLDALFVLGGGTKTNLHPRPQVASSGSRIVTAARLYHAGQAKLLICSGKQWNRTSPADLHPREEAKQLLEELNVPADRIVMIEGNNTFEEMQLIATFVQQHELTGKRIGILTSAYHIPRARRLAETNGLDPIVVPCDFRSEYYSPGPDLLIPSDRSLENSRIWIKERIARILGR